MSLEAMERIVTQIKMNSKDSSQRSLEALQTVNGGRLNHPLSEGNPTQICSQDNLGETNGRFEPSVKCSKCRDTGWLIVPQLDRQPLALSCECREIEKAKNEWKSSGINVEMTKQTFTNFKVWNEASAKAKDTATAYYSDFGKVRGSRRNSILFCGQVGSGKTHLSVALGLNFLKKKIKAVYMPYRDVITKIKQNILDQEYYTKAISKYQLCEVLLIDDLFKGKLTESDINIVFEIINYRYLNFLPIIVSTEFNIDKLLNFDEAVGSRIYEMCKDYVVEIDKEIKNNYRLK